MLMGKNFYADACTIRCTLRQPLFDLGDKMELSIESFLTPFDSQLPVSFSYMEPVVENGRRFFILHEFYFCENSDACCSLLEDLRSRSSFDWLARISAVKGLYARKLYFDGEV